MEQPTKKPTRSLYLAARASRVNLSRKKSLANSGRTLRESILPTGKRKCSPLSSGILWKKRPRNKEPLFKAKDKRPRDQSKARKKSLLAKGTPFFSTTLARAAATISSMERSLGQFSAQVPQRRHWAASSCMKPVRSAPSRGSKERG